MAAATTTKRIGSAANTAVTYIRTTIPSRKKREVAKTLVWQHERGTQQRNGKSSVLQSTSWAKISISDGENGTTTSAKDFFLSPRSAAARQNLLLSPGSSRAIQGQKGLYAQSQPYVQYSTRFIEQQNGKRSNFSPSYDLGLSTDNFERQKPKAGLIRSSFLRRRRSSAAIPSRINSSQPVERGESESNRGQRKHSQPGNSFQGTTPLAPVQEGLSKEEIAAKGRESFVKYMAMTSTTKTVERAPSSPARMSPLTAAVDPFPSKSSLNHKMDSPAKQQRRLSSAVIAASARAAQRRRTIRRSSTNLVGLPLG